MMQPLRLLTGLLFLFISVIQSDAQAHGSVTAEDDLCVINIGYFRAHFKIHLPRARQHDEFCEDLPQAGEAIFVMEYVHGDLSTVAVDFRIIRNTTGLGRFAQLKDVENIDDIDSATVFYQAPTVEEDVFTALHHFDEPGEFLGIVTAKHPESQKTYSAVFPFEVGYTKIGYLPLFFGLAVIIQLIYWRMTRSKLFGRRHPTDQENPAGRSYE